MSTRLVIFNASGRVGEFIPSFCGLIQIHCVNVFIWSNRKEYKFLKPEIIRNIFLIISVKTHKDKVMVKSQ